LNRSAQIGLRDAKLTFDPGLLMPGEVDKRFGIIAPIFCLTTGVAEWYFQDMVLSGLPHNFMMM